MGSQAKGPWVEKLEKILVREGNDKCADCDSPNPRWVSSNLGCIICIRCSGIHRSLGTHISRVRSIELDEWSDAQIQLLERKGNKRVNLVYEANIPPTTKKITAQSSFEEATSYIKTKYNGDFKSATANGWKGATVAQESLEDDKKTSASITRTHGDSHLSESDLRRRTMFLKNARGQQVPSQESLLPAGADVAESDDDSDDSAAKNQGSGIRRSPLSSSGEHGGDAVSEVWNTLEMTGVGSDLRRAQMEERKRMMNEAKLKKEAKKKEEKERKKKEDEEQKKKKRDDKKQKRKSWWRGRAMDGEAIALKHEMDSMMGQEDVYAVNEDELRDKRENDHRRVRERMRLYEEVKRQKRGQTQETTCPHCHSHVPLLSSAEVRATAVDSRQLAVEASAE